MLIIRTIQEHEKDEAYRLIATEYARYDITTFHRHPPVLLGAFEEGALAGTIGLAPAESPLDIIEAVLGDENRRILSHVCKGDCGGEIERFAVKLKYHGQLIPGALILGLLAFSHQRGISSLIAIVKPKLRDFVMHGLRLPIVVLPERLRVDKTPHIYAGYFRAGPEPLAIVFVLDDRMMEQVQTQFEREILKRNVQVIT